MSITVRGLPGRGKSDTWWIEAACVLSSALFSSLKKSHSFMFLTISKTRTDCGDVAKVILLVLTMGAVEYQAAAKGEFEAEKPLSKSRHAIVRSGQVNDAVERLTRFENKLEDERKRKMEEKKEYLKKKAKGREMEDEDEEDEAPAKKKRKRKHKKKQVEEEKEIETPKKKEKLSQKKSPILKNSKSSDSENETSNRKKKAKKVESTPVAKSHTDSEGESPKKKKKKTLTNGNVLSPIEKSPKELAPVKKVQRRKSLESGLLSSTKSDKKNERKSLDQTEAPANETILENGEIEIYIPRKPKTKKQSPKRDNFASFDSGKTPPPAFVKKAVAKTEPKKKAKKLLKADDLDTPTGNKRVSFIMARNTAQEFEDSFTEPKPFNPFVLPDTGILKPSPANSPAITPKRNMVGFEATRGNGYQSDIAVDDISITTGKCNGSTRPVDSKPSNDSSVMCNWGNMVWSRCTKTNSGWDNCTWYNDHMTNPAKSAEHWGQCVAENGTFGSCVWKNGTMQPCKWGKAAMHWAHCEWNNGLQSICHWKNNNWGGCSWLGQNRSPGNSDVQYSYNSDTMDTNKGGSSGWESNRGDGGDSMQDEWGKCTFSIGNWGYCSWDHGMLKGCHLGQMTTGTELHKYCDFGNSTTLSCSMKNGTWNNCTVDSNMNSTSTYAPNDWSICSISNGTWGFCNSKNKTCRWGKSDKMEKAKNSTVLCSWGNMTWSECQWGNGNWSGCQWHNKGNSSSNKTLEHWGQCTMDNEMWGSCKWANGSIRECYWNDGKNNNLQWAMCAWDGGVDTHCQEKNGVWMCDWGNKTMGNKSMAYTSMPIGMKNQSDHWGKCSFSFGVWAKCKAGFTSIEECHMGKGKGLTEATEKYCDWGKNMTTKCVRDMHGWKCDNSSMSNMNATNGNWSQCHMDNGTWGWCTLGNGKSWCMWGKKHRMSHSKSVMCSWHSKVWSRCKWSDEKGWRSCSWHNRKMMNNSGADMSGNGTMMNGTMMNGTMNEPHWGQCVKDDGVFGTCTFANGSMGACNWTTDPKESQPHKWARCEWSDNTISTCHYKNNSYRGCKGGGIDGSWGHCQMSTGFWAQCQLLNGSLHNCTWGDMKMENERMKNQSDHWGKCSFSFGVWAKCKAGFTSIEECHMGKGKGLTEATEKYCDWGKNMTTKCVRDMNGWKCDNSSMSNMNATNGNWSQCHMDNGTWGWCTLGNGKPWCMWGKKHRMSHSKSVMCSWHSKVWSRCKWSDEKGWRSCSWHNRKMMNNSGADMSGNGTMMNGTMMNGTMNEPHWGQCVKDDGVFGTCTFANGSMGACNWTTDPKESQPHKWARCEWSDNTISTCHYKNNSYRGCKGGGIDGSWGRCQMSTGFWAQCQLLNGSLHNCTWGDMKMKNESDDWHFCFWDRGYSTECFGTNKSNCHSVAIPNSAAMDPSGWGMCASSMGSWGFCNKDTNTCYQGTMKSVNVMCSWHSKVWSRCKWSDEKGWRSCSWHNRKMMNNSGADMSGNGTMMNGTMMNGTMNEPHWGQCVKDDGVFGTCTFANGSMGACNWTTDPKESQPHKWARCEWSDNTISTCHYKNNSYRGCKGGGIDGSWGHCQMSTGFWAQCQLLNGSLHNCTWGDMKMKNESDDWHFCFWDRGYSTECFGTNKSNCHSVAIPNSAAMDPSGWGMCASSMGSWGFCNKDTNTCYQGTMNKTTVLCSWGPGVWSNCAWSKKGWDKCSWYKNPNKLSDKNSSATHWGQCIRDDKVWGTCLFANGSMGACNWTTDPIESKPRKWARCQWQDDSSSICFEGDTGFGDCSSRGVGIGKCIFSTGVWKKCMMNGRTLANCTGNNDDSFRKDCFWDNGYSTTCHDSQGKNCTHSTTMRQTPAAPVWGMCFTSNNKWGWCNKVKMECYFGSYNANVTGRLANDMTEMRIHPAMSVVKANYPAKLLCNILEVASSKDKPIISWHFPNGTKIHNTGLRGFRQQDRFQTKTLYSVDSGEYMSSLAMSLTNPEMSGFFECHAAYNGKNVIAKTLVLIEVCGTGSYKCGDNECIPNRWVCDGRADCSNLSDEINCI
ncbi:hypothetical protein CAPTEDRAFT_221969 [Capitella teleta]|uniref:MAM domain-containing protein n=1 Tax=Capitella teleta TaxID=283909 RepID=R7U3M9_CAPTE|nr:hypothetical protein CAPTEDRAFT_221969 [Capitella teleta]|eukprot:ELU00589.1 hypothetical protein CAPTEDRAFT_221969 [Capitella teleta]